MKWAVFGSRLARWTICGRAGGRAITPVPPHDLIRTVLALRSTFADIAVMHCCDQDCAPECDLTDESESAYRYHDEHNADVRERIHDDAMYLVAALEEWVGPITTDSGAAAEPDAAKGHRESGRVGSHLAPLIITRDHDDFQRWWDTDADRAEITDQLEGLTDESPAVDALHELMLLVFQSRTGVRKWWRVEGLSLDAGVRWLGLDIDPAYDGDGMRDGAHVVLNMTVDVPERRHVWLAVSVYVDRPSRVLAPHTTDPCTALGEIIDRVLALVNDEISKRDAFTAAARTVTEPPSAPRDS